MKSDPTSRSELREFALLRSDQWHAVLTHFDYNEGFSFGLILVPEAALAEQCRAALSEHLAKSGKELLDLSPPSAEALRHIANPLLSVDRNRNFGAVWVSAVVPTFHPEYELWFAAWREGFARLNQYRNMLQRQIPCTLVFIGAAWVQAVVRTMAPDLWSVRSWVAPLVSAFPLHRSERAKLEAGPVGSHDAPDPEFALAEANHLRGRAGQEVALARLLSRAGRGFLNRNEFEKASESFRESLALLIDAHTDELAALADSYAGLATALEGLERLEAAVQPREEALELSRRLFGDTHERTLTAMNKLANTLANLGRLEEAMVLYKTQEALSFESGNKLALQWSYGNQGLVLRDWGRPEEALELLKKQMSICLELDHKEGLQRSYANQALLLQESGRLEEALDLLKKQETLSLELNDKSGLERSYGNQAWVLKSWGRMEEALNLLKKQEALCVEIRDRHGLQWNYSTQAEILRAWGRAEEGLGLLNKRETLCLELGDQDGLQWGYLGEVLCLQDLGRLDEALALLKKHEALCLDLGLKDGLRRSYGSQATTLRRLGRLEEAVSLRQKEEALCLDLGDRASLALCYWNWAPVSEEQGDHDTARQKLQTAMGIFAELNMPEQREAVQAALDRLKTHT
jgi:tetratricopeptide (TPR) repeat protein